MKSKVLYSFTGSLVVAGSVLAASAIVVNYAPAGKARDRAERWLTAPGKMLHDKMDHDKNFRRWRKEGRKTIETGQEKLEDTADRLGLIHAYNAGAWALAGFILCFLMTLFFGVSSFWSAVTMGLKAALALIFLQGALIFAGILAYQ